MSDKTKDFAKLLEKDEFVIPQLDDIIKGKVITASKAEVRLDIAGVLIGVIRGPELYLEAEEYANLKPGDEVEAAVVDTENERGEVELSFRRVGQEKAWENLQDAFDNKKIVTIRIVDANKGGLLARYRQIHGFLPVSQLAPDNYPRISGGDKTKILEKLKTFVGQDFEVNVISIGNEEDKIIFSEKDVWAKKKKHIISKYTVGKVVEGTISAITNFGVFVSFGENMEGLIHISELAWQRIDSPSELFKVGDVVKAEIVNIEDSKIFLSAKKLLVDPWKEASAKYKVNQVVKGTILKVNPFGLFVELDEDIHGLAHVSQLDLKPKEKITDTYSAGDKLNFEIMSIIPEEHRLGLKVVREKRKNTKEEKVKESPEETKEEEEKKE